MSRQHQPAPEGKDPALWEIAQKRAAFKKHLTNYIIINAFLWGLWFVTNNQHKGFNISEWSTNYYPWPIWTSLGWGIGIAFHYAAAYISPKSNAVETEYQKLQDQQKK